MRFEQTIAIDFVDVILGVTIQMRATKQHFPKVWFITLYNVALLFESVDEIL